MPTTYTQDGRDGTTIFTRTAIPNPFKKDVRDLVSDAVRDYDWKLLITNKGHMTLIAPEPNQEQTFNLSPTKTDGPIKRMRSAIEKFGITSADPVAEAPAKAQPVLKDNIAKAADAAEQRAKEQSFKEIQEQRRKDRNRIKELDEEERRAEELDDIIARGQARREAAKEEELAALLEVEGAAAEKYGGPDPVVTETERSGPSGLLEDRVVDASPMIAHRGSSETEGRGYLSPTTLEVKWASGRTTYRCRLEGCTDGEDGGPYESAWRRGPGAHWALHVNRGEAVPASTMERAAAPIILPPWEPAYKKGGYTPRVDRVRALALHFQQVMEAGIDWSDLPAAVETLAAEALTWAHEQSNQAGELAGEREPLTAEEILVRVRNLLDNGEYMAQRAEIAAQRQRIDALEEMTLAADLAREKAESDLQAIHDLTRRGEAS